MDSTLIKLFGNDAIRLYDSTATVAGVANNQHEQIVSGIIVILLFIAYISMIYRHGHTIADLFKIFSLKGYMYKVVEQAGTSFKHLCIWSHITAILAVIISVVRVDAQYCFINVETHISQQWLVPIVAAIAFLLFISICRNVLLKIIGFVTGKADFIRKLNTQNEVLYTIAVVTTTPSIILGIMSSGIFFQTFATITIISLIINALIFTRQSLKIFLDKKISIFQWFLYLCGVEIMPLSFVIALILRA